MLSGKRHLKLSLIWVLVNFVGIMAGTLVAFFLSALLTLNYDNVTLDVLQLLIWLTICGAIQGFIVSVLQMMVLLLQGCQLVKWLAANVISMAIGRGISIAYQVALHPNFEISGSFDDYAMAGWILSWPLAGACSGIVLGKASSQKIRWGVLNAGAYLYWGACAAWGIHLLSIGLYYTPTLSSRWLGSFGGIAVMFVIGAWLQSYVFGDVMNWQHDVKTPHRNHNSQNRDRIAKKT